MRRLVRRPASLDHALHGHAPEASGEPLQALQLFDGLGRECPGAKEHDRDSDAPPLQLDQQVEAGLLQQDDDDVDIDGAAERAEQRVAITETPDDETLLRQLVGQGPAVDRVAIEEKDANGVRRAIAIPEDQAGGGVQPGKRGADERLEGVMIASLRSDPSTGSISICTGQWSPNIWTTGRVSCSHACVAPSVPVCQSLQASIFMPTSRARWLRIAMVWSPTEPILTLTWRKPASVPLNYSTPC